MSLSSEDRRVRAKSIYRGIRQLVISESGRTLYELNDTPAKRIWDFLERTVLREGSRDIVMSRFPGKHIWDTLALAQVCVRPDFNLRQKFDCLKFYFDGAGLNNLLASTMRSGSAWTELTVSLAVDLARGGTGDYGYSDDNWIPDIGYTYALLDWRTPANIQSPSGLYDVSNSVNYHTHLPYHRLRCRRVKTMNVVIIVRSILESLESNYFKLARSEKWPEITLDDEDSFNWDLYIDGLIGFYNSWGFVAEWHPSCRVFKYHEIKADPPAAFKDITDFWGLNLPLECIEEALRRSSKKAMAKKVPKEEHATVTRVSYREQRGIISEARKNYILGRLQRELIHDFGFDYSENHEWGKYYD